jgi:hypothetical protein
MDLGVLLTGTFWQKPYGPGPIFPGTFLVGTFLAGTFGSLEPFSQELFLQERFGRNLLVGTFWQEPIVIPPQYFDQRVRNKNKNKNNKNNKNNKTENHFSHYPRSQVDISSYTRLNIATSFNCGKSNKLLVKVCQSTAIAIQLANDMIINL